MPRVALIDRASATPDTRPEAFLPAMLHAPRRAEVIRDK